jgi:tetratricopeptide (TPR) repeat protein
MALHREVGYMVDAARVGGSVPTYRHCLALLGQYFNQQHATNVTVAEVDTGFLLYFFISGRWTKATVTPIHHSELLELTGTTSGSTAGKGGVLVKGGDQRDKKHPLVPMGYDAFFRAVGTRLDRRSASAVTICETPERIYVSYWVDKASYVMREGHRQAVSSAQLEPYDAAAIQRLLKSNSETYAQEVSQYVRGLKINPHDHISMQDVAFLLEDEGEFREAESLYSRIVAEVPEHPEAHYHLARLLLARGDKRGALSAIKRAVKTNGTDPAVHDLAGRVLRQNGKLKDAIVAFERAVELDSTNDLYHYHLSKAYEAAGRAEDAAAEMALSATMFAPPAWEVVPEDIAIVVRPAALEPIKQPLPTPAAVPAPTPAVSPGLPTMTTTFEPSESALPTESPASGPVDKGLSGPKPTTFAKIPRTAPVAAESPQSAPMTLEQRMRAARAAPIMPSPQRDAEPPKVAERSPIELMPQGLQSFAALKPLEPAPSPVVTQHEGATRPSSGVTQVEARPSSGAIHADARPPSGVTHADARPPSGVTDAEAWLHTAAPEVGRSQPAAPVSAAPAPDEAATNAVELAAEIMLIRRALEAEPNRADLRRKLGFMLARQGNTAEAAAEFRRALQASRTSL